MIWPLTGQRRALATAAAGAALVLALSGAAGGCGSSGTTITVPGTAPAKATCTNTVPDPAGNPSGITVSSGMVVGTMTIDCAGTPPDTYYFALFLVHNGEPVQLRANDENPVTLPPEISSTVTALFPCSPGSWRVYFQVAWTLGAGKYSNAGKTPDRELVLDDC